MFAQSKDDFARSLMRERDYFRAISVYKELAFFSKSADSTIFYSLQIGKAYRLSQKYQLSVAQYSSLLNYPKLPDSLTCSIYRNLGLNYLGMSIPAQASVYFQEARKIDKTDLSLFYLGLTAIEASDWNGAQSYYDQITKQAPASRLGLLSAEFSQTLVHVDQLSYKSRLLSCLLSAVIPGSGQAYCGHYVDAVQAFAFVSSFGFATYLAYQHDKDHHSNYVLTGIAVSITGLFHLANIIGAERTATYYNQRQKELFIQDIRQKSYEVDN
jgi:tetratricopeptide (TPR) repeat protein